MNTAPSMSVRRRRLPTKMRKDDRLVHDSHCTAAEDPEETLTAALIGFFLHIPFHRSEIFRLLPHREQLWRGLSGQSDRLSHPQLRASFANARSPMGIENESIASMSGAQSVARRCSRGASDVASSSAWPRVPSCPRARRAAPRARREQLLSESTAGLTTGHPRKLLAMERLLERSPQYRSKC